MVDCHYQCDPDFDRNLCDFCPMAEMSAAERDATVLDGITKDGCFQ